MGYGRFVLRGFGVVYVFEGLEGFRGAMVGVDRMVCVEI